MGVCQAMTLIGDPRQATSEGKSGLVETGVTGPAAKALLCVHREIVLHVEGSRVGSAGCASMLHTWRECYVVGGSNFIAIDMVLYTENWSEQAESLTPWGHSRQSLALKNV